MKIVKLEDITYEEIITVLENSGLVIYPADTCYGIGCNPADQRAVDKLLRYKARREGKAISIAVNSQEMAEEYVYLNETAKNFYARFLPGPYTVVSRSKNVVAKGIEAENDTLGIRIPDSKWLLDLVGVYGKAVTSTSANQSYQKTPYKIEDILKNASQKSLKLIDLIIDAGELPHNPPSTVLDTTVGDIQILRKGEFLPEGSRVNEFVSSSEQETIKFGEDIFERFRTNIEFRPLIFALQGDLGAGKTQFTKGIAKAMGIEEQVISPTFILSREYKSPFGNMLYHIDTWRLENEVDFESLGIEEILEQRKNSASANVVNPQISKPVNYNVLSIEWADKVSDYLRKLDPNLKIIWVEISSDSNNESTRIIKWSE